MRAKITNEFMRSLPELLPIEKPLEVNDTELKGFMLRIQPHPSDRTQLGTMSFILRYRLHGKQTRHTIGRCPPFKPMQARAIAEELLRGVATGEAPSARRRTSQTLGEFLSGDFQTFGDSHYKRPGTIKDLCAVLGEDLLAKPIAAVTAWDLERWARARLKVVSANTVARDLRPLRVAFKKALEWGVREDVPAFPKIRETDEERVRYLSAEEAQRLYAALGDSKLWVRTIVLVALNTGARLGELAKLQWSAVDFDKRTVTLTASTTKANTTRHVPLNQAALEALKTWQSHAPKSAVFDLPDYERSKAAQNALKYVLRRAKIEDFRFHDLRHTFASWLVMRGIDIYTVSQLLGHSSVEMTKRYAHLAPEHKAAAVAVLDAVPEVIQLRKAEEASQ